MSKLQGLRLAFELQLRAGLSSQPVEINCFGRHAQSPVAVVAAATARLANTTPVGRLITGAAKTSQLHKALQPIQAVSVFLLPVRIDSPRHQSQQMTG